MPELLDVLDSEGNYTGKTADRAVAHADGLWHKGVVLFIVSPDHQHILLQKRSHTKKLWPGLWDVGVGGHVDAGEFGYQTIIREAAEELGLKLSEHDPLFIGCSTSTQSFGDIKNNHFNEYYVLERDFNPSDLTLQPDEVDEVRWFDRTDLVARIKNNYDGITDKAGCWGYLLKYLGAYML